MKKKTNKHDKRNCGCMQTEDSVYSENGREEPDSPGTSGKSTSVRTKSLIAGAAVIVLLCGGAFGIFKLIQTLDYMRPVKDICNIYNNRETDPAHIYKAAYSGKDEKAYNSACKIIANADEYYQYFEKLPEELEAYYRDNAAAGGNGIKMKFDTTGDKIKMDESQLAIIYNEFEANAPYYSAVVNDIDSMGKEDWQTMADAMGISLKRAQSLGSAIRKRCSEYTSFNITSGYYVTGRFVLTNDKGDTVNKTEKITLSVIKLNGSWYLYEGRADGLMLATGSSFLAEKDVLWEIYEKYIQ